MGYYLFDFKYDDCFLLGVVLGNLIQGIPIDENFEYQGDFVQLLNPYALLTGLTTLASCTMHGSIYLVMKTEKRLYTKLSIMVSDTSRFFVVCYILQTMVTLVYFPSMSATFKAHPTLFAVPLITVLIIINTRILLEKGKYMLAFMSSAFTMASLLVTVAMNLFPKIIHSTINPAYSVTIYNGASSENHCRLFYSSPQLAYRL